MIRHIHEWLHLTPVLWLVLAGQALLPMGEAGHVGSWAEEIALQRHLSHCRHNVRGLVALRPNWQVHASYSLNQLMDISHLWPYHFILELPKRSERVNFSGHFGPSLWLWRSASLADWFSCTFSARSTCIYAASGRPTTERLSSRYAGRNGEAGVSRIRGRKGNLCSRTIYMIRMVVETGNQCQWVKWWGAQSLTW